MKSRFIAFLATLLFALPAWGVAEQLTDSFLLQSHSKQSRTAMMMRCDNSLSLSNTGAIGGEVCESGDWSKAFDCSDFQHLTIQFWEYGGGSAQLFVWDCARIAGTTGVDGGGTKPGEIAPVGSATGDDQPDPLCYELTAPGGIVDFDGLSAGDTFLHLSGQQFHFIVAEIENCTGDCDSTVILSCGR